MCSQVGTDKEIMVFISYMYYGTYIELNEERVGALGSVCLCKYLLMQTSLSREPSFLYLSSIRFDGSTMICL